MTAEPDLPDQPDAHTDDVHRVRAAFDRAGFLVGGQNAHASLTRLFGAHDELTLDEVGIEPDALAAMQRLGLVRIAGDRLRAAMRVDPYTASIGAASRSGWLVSDFLGARPLPADHVLGAGGAATTLAAITARRAVGSALDLGTGGGIQLLHLAGHAQSLVGTDTNPRALRLAGLSMALSGVSAELLRGDRFTPVQDRRFDLIVSNPPMVIGPSSRLEYRDSRLEGDAMTRSIVEGAPAHLTEGGSCQLLGHWLHVGTRDWRETVAGWFPQSGLDAWMVQREVLDPAAYVDLWLEDSGDDDGSRGRSLTQLRERWLGWFAEHEVTAIGMGWITLRRTDDTPTITRLEELRQPVEQPVGAAISQYLDAVGSLRLLNDDGVLARAWRVLPGVRLDQRWRAEGGQWQADGQNLVQLSLLLRVAGIDGIGAAVLGACDGKRPLRDVLRGITADFEIDVRGLEAGVIEALRGLAADGFVEVCAPPD